MMLMRVSSKVKTVPKVTKAYSLVSQD